MLRSSSHLKSAPAVAAAVAILSIVVVVVAAFVVAVAASQPSNEEDTTMAARTGYEGRARTILIDVWWEILMTKQGDAWRCGGRCEEARERREGRVRARGRGV